MNKKTYLKTISSQLKNVFDPLRYIEAEKSALIDKFYRKEYSFETIEDSSEVTPEIFSDLQELSLLVKENRYETGSYYTNKKLISRILKERDFYQKTIFDPAAGTGNFIISAILMLIDGFDSKEEFLLYFQKYIFLNELEKSSLDIFYLRLSFILFNQFDQRLSAEDIEKIKGNVFNRDFLLDFDDNLRFDFIVGNPPYLGVKSLGQEYYSSLKKKFGYVDDLYSLFTIKSLKMYNEFLSFITSSTYITTISKSRMRRALWDGGLYKIEDVPRGEFQIQTNTTILFCLKGANKKNRSVEYRKEKIFLGETGAFVFPATDKTGEMFERSLKIYHDLGKKISTTKSVAKNEKFLSELEEGILPLGAIAYVGTGIGFKGNTDKVLHSLNGKYRQIDNISEIKEDVSKSEFVRGFSDHKYIKAVKGVEELFVKWDIETVRWLRSVGAEFRNIELYGDREMIACKTSTYQFKKIDKNTVCINTAGACFIKPFKRNVDIDRLQAYLSDDNIRKYLKEKINNSLCLTPNDIKKIPVVISEVLVV